MALDTNETLKRVTYGGKDFILDGIKPSGTLLIEENGDFDVTDYARASVKVEPELRERDIIGTWSAESGFSLVLDKNGIGSYANIPIIYSITNNQIVVYIEGVEEPLYLVYNEDADTISVYGDDTVVLTRVQQTATLITKEITENGTYKASDDGADGYSEVVVNVAGSEEEVVVPPPFASATVSDIKRVGNEISAKGLTSDKVASLYGWNIGDTTNITLTTGEVIQMRIIGFNHDALSDGSGTAGITLEMVNCLNTKYGVNATMSSAGGYPVSVMRNTHLPMIKETLPKNWVDIIKSVNKACSVTGWYQDPQLTTLNESLFLLSTSELFGLASTTADEGSQYEYYVGKSNSSRIKKVSNTASIWWQRTPYSGGNAFRYVATSGANDYGTSSISAGVSFAFCVGSAKDIPKAGDPIEASTDQEMTNALVEDNLGKVYKFTGTSDTYETDGIYIVSEV